jgi:hypothetical protein
VANPLTYRIDIHRTGMLSEMAVQRHFYEQGWDVFTPIDNKTRADLVVVNPESGDVLRVQVKTVQPNRVGQYTYLQSRLSSPDNTTVYTSQCCDVIAFVYGERLWIAPIEEVEGLKSVCLDRISENESSYNRRVNYDPTKWEIH